MVFLTGTITLAIVLGIVGVAKSTPIRFDFTGTVIWTNDWWISEVFQGSVSVAEGDTFRGSVTYDCTATWFHEAGEEGPCWTHNGIRTLLYFDDFSIDILGSSWVSFFEKDDFSQFDMYQLGYMILAGKQVFFGEDFGLTFTDSTATPFDFYNESMPPNLHSATFDGGSLHLAFIDAGREYDVSILGTLDNITEVPIPEPATMLLLGSGLAGLAMFRRKFRKG